MTGIFFGSTTGTTESVAARIAERLGVKPDKVFVNQTAAFSDYHGTWANPAANASYTDAAFVANRFRVITSRRHI